MKNIKEDKRLLRKKCKEKLKNINHKLLTKKAVEFLAEFEPFLQAKVVYAYKPFGYEIPFVERLQALFPEKEFCFPEVLDNGEMSFCNKNPDIVFVPAMCVTKNGERLGRGGGHYDRFLKQLYKKDPGILTISVMPKEAVLENIPQESHDIKIKKIVAL